MCVCVLDTQSCLTFCNPMDYSPEDSSVHGIVQARILEWGAISSSRNYAPVKHLYSNKNFKEKRKIHRKKERDREQLGWGQNRYTEAPPIFGLSCMIVTEKAMAPCYSTLAWKIPWTEEPGRLQSMGSRRVGHDWATSLWLFTFMHWRRNWQPTPVFLPGESQGLRSRVGCRLWGRTELDTTDAT